MELHDALQELGLDEKSITVYLAAMELGETLLLPLAQHAGIKRPTMYEVLPKLHEAGLISYGRQGKRRTVIAQDPSQLLFIQEEKLHNLRRLMPQLLSKYNRHEAKPKIYSYEGVTGIQKVYEDAIAEGFSIRSFLNPRDMNPAIERFLVDYLMPKRVKKGIRIKNLVSGEPGTDERLLQKKGYLRDNRYVDAKQFPADIEMLIYSNKVGFVTYEQGSEPMGIIIQGREIAETLRSLFEMAWRYADEHGKNTGEE